MKSIGFVSEKKIKSTNRSKKQQNWFEVFCRLVKENGCEIEVLKTAGLQRLVKINQKLYYVYSHDQRRTWEPSVAIVKKMQNAYEDNWVLLCASFDEYNLAEFYGIKAEKLFELIDTLQTQGEVENFKYLASRENQYQITVGAEGLYPYEIASGELKEKGNGDNNSL